MLSSPMEQEKVLNISRREEAASKVVIVGRDSLTSGLLADSLAHNLRCDAVATALSMLHEIRYVAYELVRLLHGDPVPALAEENEA